MQQQQPASPLKNTPTPSVNKCAFQQMHDLGETNPAVFYQLLPDTQTSLRLDVNDVEWMHGLVACYSPNIHRNLPDSLILHCIHTVLR